MRGGNVENPHPVSTKLLGSLHFACKQLLSHQLIERLKEESLKRREPVRIKWRNLRFKEMKINPEPISPTPGIPQWGGRVGLCILPLDEQDFDLAVRILELDGGVGARAIGAP